MEQQLQLLDTPVDWRLDQDTRDIGRRGILAARAALEQALRQARVEDAPRAA
jgi:hypothetical protein